jgi:hypothetical protein
MNYPRFEIRTFGLLTGFETTLSFRPPLLFFVGVSRVQYFATNLLSETFFLISKPFTRSINIPELKKKFKIV